MPSTTIRQSILSATRRIVVKLGTQLLIGSDRKPDVAYFRSMAAQVAKLRERGCEVTLVSSGAIGAGVAELGLKSRPSDVAEQQAVAAVGQRRLMAHWHEAFDACDLHVGQLLLTYTDFEDRERFLNLRNCITRLHSMQCVPIINENDTVAVEEIRFGDNDMLAALTCNAVHAEALVILSVVDGLLDAQGNRIDLVRNVQDVKELDRKEKSSLGTGGMTTKLQAAKLVTEAGEVAVVANGREQDVLLKLFDGKSLGVGTVFAPAARARKLDSRERWIGLTKRPTGAIVVDDGAAAALRERGKSLLATGVRAIEGAFAQGQVVSIQNAAGDEVARGLCNYSDAELRRIMGKKSSQFEAILGRQAYAEVIHRDNLVVMGS